MGFSLFLLIFYTLLVGGTVFLVVKLIKKWSDKYVVVSKDKLCSFCDKKEKTIESEDVAHLR